MRFVITGDMEKLEYQSYAFWKQYDEVEVENPNGWYIRFVERGIVHSFGYSQSSGRGEYISEYCEDEYTKPLNFTTNAKANAEIMHKTSYDGKKAVLIRVA